MIARQYKKILLPLDGTSFSEALIPHAISLCRSFQADCHLIRILEPPTQFSPLAYAGFVPIHDPVGIYLRDHEDERKNAMTYLSGQNAVFGEHGIRSTVELREGDVVTEIVATAAEQKSDLILIATHQRSGIGRLLVPNTSTLVTLQAGCPVFVVCDDETVGQKVEKTIFENILGTLKSEQKRLSHKTGLTQVQLEEALPSAVAILLGALAEDRVRGKKLEELMEMASGPHQTVASILESDETPDLKLVSEAFGRRGAWAASETSQLCDSLDSHQSLVLISHITPVVLHLLAAMAVKDSELQSLLKREVEEAGGEPAVALNAGSDIVAV